MSQKFTRITPDIIARIKQNLRFMTNAETARQTGISTYVVDNIAAGNYDTGKLQRHYRYREK